MADKPNQRNFEITASDTVTEIFNDFDEYIEEMEINYKNTIENLEEKVKELQEKIEELESNN
jgi:TolA-binding protein